MADSVRGAQSVPTPSHDSTTPSGDPWQAFSYLVTGVLMYGGIGWLADRWLGTSFLVVIGILAGSGLGMYMTWLRFGAPASQDAQPGEGSTSPGPGRSEEGKQQMTQKETGS